MLKMVDGTGIIGVDMVCPLGGAVSPPQPPNFDKVEVEGVGGLMLPNSLKAPIERLELIGNSVQGENPAPDNPQEIKSAGRYDESSGKYLLDVKVTGKNLFDINYFKEKSNLQTIQGGGFTLLGIICNVKPNTKYTLSARLAEVKYNLNIANKVTRYSLTSSPSRTLVSNADGTLYIGLFNATVNSINMDDFMQQYQNIQLEEGTIATDYEAYQEPQTLTLTSDRPITKWDKLVEQGGQYGWLYQSASNTDVKPSRLDLFPNGFSLFKDFGNGVYVYKVTNIKKAIGFQTSLCEQFKNKDGSYSTGDLFCYSDQPSMQMQYFVTDIPTLEEFKTWMEANPLTMVYKTTESHFIPLPESEQTQLRNLHSYIGTTNIMVDSGEIPCGIKLTYRKEK
nr:MAG TPA: hypothetical protein [Caudoviricetes sp.]